MSEEESLISDITLRVFIPVVVLLQYVRVCTVQSKTAITSQTQTNGKNNNRKTTINRIVDSVYFSVVRIVDLMAWDFETFLGHFIVKSSDTIINKSTYKYMKFNCFDPIKLFLLRKFIKFKYLI